jgi:NitT/TauT family transport system permease protein
MTAREALRLPPIRPEFERDTQDASRAGEVERPLSAWERLTNITLVRRLFILAMIALVWELYARWVQNDLMFPTFTQMVAAFWDTTQRGEMLAYAWGSLKVLVLGYAAGVACATVLTMLAVSTRLGNDFLATVTSMFNPLPAIALLPLALLWFGLGTPSLVFVLIHAVLWPLALNTHSGFLSVSETLRMVGRNSGLTGMSYIARILIPAAFPAILTGLKIGWAFAWRTLIAAELVFGAGGGGGGLGWFIFQSRNELLTAHVFAGLTAVIIIGLLVESVIFRAIEARTVRKWGMQRG